MRNHLIIILLLVLMPLVSWGKLNTSPSLSASVFNSNDRETATLTVSLNNGSIVCNGYQFKLVLPKGVKLAYDDEEEEYVYELANRYTKKNKMEVQIEEYEDGTYQLMCFSLSDQTLTGSDGPVISLVLRIDSSVSPGNYQGMIKDAVISNSDSGFSEQLEDAIFVIAVTGWASSTASISAEATVASPGETCMLTVSLNNGSIVCNGYQFKLVLPKGVKLAYDDEEEEYVYELANRYTKKNKMELQIEEYEDRTYQLMCFSLSDQTLTGSDGPIITLGLQVDPFISSGSHQGVITEAVLSNYDTGFSEQLDDAIFTISIDYEPITITVKDCEREYGEENPTFEYTVEGGTIEGTPSITCTATKTSPVVEGGYVIAIAAGTIAYPNLVLKNGTLTVTKAPLNVTAKSYTREQGQPNPEFVIAYEGFKNGETEANLSKMPKAATTATEDSAPGTYPITVSGGEAQNYEFSYVNGTLTVLPPPPPVTITVKSYEREYGEENPIFEYTVEGGTIEGTPTITCEATKSSPAGSYTIFIEVGTIDYSNLILVNGALTITKAPLTVKATSYIREYGQPNPEFEITYEGFKNGENEDVLIQKPTAGTEADENSFPGIYDIVVWGGESQNYDFNYVYGSLTVKEAPLITITVKDCEREYGEENPVFEYTVEGGTIEGLPTPSCSATKTSPVVEEGYVITVDTTSISYPNLMLVNGTLTVTKAPLTVSAKSYSRTQGELNPEFEITYSGLKNDENEDVLTRKPTVTTEATAESAPGDYLIIVSGGEAQNYNFIYVNGTLTIVPPDNIDGFILDDISDSPIYNLQGIRVTSPRQGVYIQNGRKIVIRKR